MTTLLLMFAMAAAADWLSCEWHGARERGRLAKLGALSAVIEILNWIPVYVAIVNQELSYVVAAVVGSVVGAVLGGAREKHKRARAEAAQPPRAVGTPQGSCRAWRRAHVSAPARNR